MSAILTAFLCGLALVVGALAGVIMAAATVLKMKTESDRTNKAYSERIEERLTHQAHSVERIAVALERNKEGK